MTPKAESTTPVLDAVANLIASVELDEMGETNAAIARALAQKLDELNAADSGAVAMAISGIAKELRAVVHAILEGTQDNEEFVSGLFADVGDTENP